MSSENHGGSAKRSVMVVGEVARARELKAKLAGQGYDVVGTAATAGSAARLFTSKAPSVIVLHLDAEHLDVARIIPALLEERRCPMVAVCESCTPDMVEAACAASACGFLTRDVTPEGLSAQIQVSCSRFNAFEKLFHEKTMLAQDLETRKYVDRAKAILMKRAGLTEPEAHRRLQQESQRRRLSMGEVAKRVVETDELLGDG